MKRGIRFALGRNVLDDSYASICSVRKASCMGANKLSKI